MSLRIVALSEWTRGRLLRAGIGDSVVRVIDAVPTVFRRARGYVPRGIPVVPVHHLAGHIESLFLQQGRAASARASAPPTSRRTT